jgi:eukaryotic-like serine/threonine-protein kinase
VEAEQRILNDRYEILRPVGQGGMGAVYLAYDRQESREVALKSFPPAARRVEDLAHFEHEFLTLSRLRHPNLARVYDFGVIEGTQDVFFTSDYIPGRDLLEVCKGLEPGRLAKLLVQVCRGLEYIHSREIIHYDVKPSNILVTQSASGEDVVKLIDFGLAAQRIEDSLGIIKGTVSYLAPEVARHRPVDHRADLYSLGVTIFHCVTGTLPFSGETNLDVVRRVVSDAPPSPRELVPDLDRRLSSLILRLMAKDPAERYAGGNEVIQALGEIYDEDFAIEPRQATLDFVSSGGFCGRDAEFQVLADGFERIFSWRDADDPLADLPPALSEVRPSNDEGSSSRGFTPTSSGGFVLEFSDVVDGEAVNGDTAPVGAFEIVSERSSGDAWAALERDLSEPSAEAPAALQDEGPLQHVTLISGELGVGKSRLLREFKTHAQLQRVAVAEGHARREGGAYEPFVDVFRGVLGLWDERDKGAARQTDPLRRRLLQRYGAEISRLIPQLEEGFLPVTTRSPLGDEQAELRLLDALAQFLIGYSRVRPLVVVLHDFDQADTQTVALVEYLCRNLSLIESARALSRRTNNALRPLRLQVLISYRPPEPGSEPSPQVQALEALLETEVVGGLVLQPLSKVQVTELVESMLGKGTSNEELAERIFQETKGNPYFTVEVMRSLVETGALSRREGTWRLDLSGGVKIPATMQEVILERTRRVAAQERWPLEILAVLGRPAPTHELSAAQPERAGELVSNLASLERRRVLFSERRAGDQLHYDFFHEVARRAVYDAIDPADRIALHEACGEHLERRAELGQTSDATELFRHFVAAGSRSKALQYGIRAGDEACAVHAYQRGIAAYSEALPLLPAGSSRWRDLVAKTGDLLARIGDTEQAAAAYQQILDLDQRLLPNERVRARRRQGQILEQRGDYEGALEALSLATVAGLGQDGVEREAAQVLTATASIYEQTGRYRDAIGFCEAAVAQLVGLSEDEEVAQVRLIEGRCHVALGELPAAERALERCLGIRRRLGDEAGMAEAIGELGLAAFARGDMDDAISRFERALERETALGHAAGVALAARRLAQAARERGDHERAVPLLRRSLNIHEKTGNRAEVVRAKIELGRLHGSIGEYTSALTMLSQARLLAEELDLRAEAARALNATARLMADLGAASEASKSATEALRIASLHGELPRERASALETLGRTRWLSDDLDAAEQLLNEAQALFLKQNDPRGVARTRFSVLELLLARGAVQLARALLDQLLEEGVPESMATDLNRLRVEVDLGEPEAEVSSRHLGLLERSAGQAERARSVGLAWRIATTRGRVLERLDQPESALRSFVEAMSAIRRALEEVPSRLRPGYLQLPACRRCKSDFARLRGKE